jgi:hypothetical protein
MLFLKAVLAFAISGGIAWVELVTSRYPRTVQLFWRRSRALWVYAALYGAIACGFTLGYEPLARAGVFRIEIAGAREAPAEDYHPSWLIAVLIGLSTRALLHIRIFSVPSAGSKDTFPVGTETLILLFEPWLLESVALTDYNAVAEYLGRKTAHYPDLDAVKVRIREGLPAPSSPLLPDVVRKALLDDIKSAKTVEIALETYLRAFGVASLDQRFPG